MTCEHDETPDTIKERRPCIKCKYGIRRDFRGENCPIKKLKIRIGELENQVENQKILIESLPEEKADITRKAETA